MTFNISRLPEHLVQASNQSWWVYEGAWDGQNFHGDHWHYVQNQTTIAIRSAKDHSQATIDGIEAGAKATRAAAKSLAEALNRPEDGRAAYVANNAPFFGFDVAVSDAAFNRMIAAGRITGWQ